ncbi:MAG: hypothetical protein HC824_00820 [Synechococcales cyanobacterium RM1_1_8]|nr:hypothetical protein [Synechococcales cyanobacterium RM1_1_8]
MASLIAEARTTTEWEKVGLAGQTRILASERLLQEMYAKDPDSITDDVLEALETKRSRVNEILGL